MTGPGSVQLRLFLRQIRSGVSCDVAAVDVGMLPGEARLTVHDETRGLLADIDLRVPPRWLARRLGPLAGMPLGDAAMVRLAGQVPA